MKLFHGDGVWCRGLRIAFSYFTKPYTQYIHFSLSTRCCCHWLLTKPTDSSLSIYRSICLLLFIDIILKLTQRFVSFFLFSLIFHTLQWWLLVSDRNMIRRQKFKGIIAKVCSEFHGNPIQTIWNTWCHMSWPCFFLWA